GQNRTSQGEGESSNQKGQDDTQSGNVVSLDQFRNRNNRTPQGDQEGNTDHEGSTNNEGTTNDETTSGNEQQGESDGNNTVPIPNRDLSSRNDARNLPDDQNDNTTASESGIYTNSKLEDRQRARTHPEAYEKQNRDNKNSSDTTMNPQTSGDVTPPKRITQWEADKQVERQKQSGEPNNGRQSRKNRTPQDGSLSERQKQLQQEGAEGQQDH